MKKIKGKSQVERLYNLLKDGMEHSTVEILDKVYGSLHFGIARISARIYDVKKKYEVKIKNRQVPNSPISYYQIDYGENEQEIRTKEC